MTVLVSIILILMSMLVVLVENNCNTKYYNYTIKNNLNTNNNLNIVNIVNSN